MFFKMRVGGGEGIDERGGEGESSLRENTGIKKQDEQIYIIFAGACSTFVVMDLARCEVS